MVFSLGWFCFRLPWGLVLLLLFCVWNVSQYIQTCDKQFEFFQATAADHGRPKSRHEELGNFMGTKTIGLDMLWRGAPRNQHQVKGRVLAVKRLNEGHFSCSWHGNLGASSHNWWTYIIIIYLLLFFDLLVWHPVTSAPALIIEDHYHKKHTRARCLPELGRDDTWKFGLEKTRLIEGIDIRTL